MSVQFESCPGFLQMLHCTGQLHAVGAFKQDAVALLKVLIQPPFYPGQTVHFEIGRRCMGCFHSAANGGCQFSQQKYRVQRMLSYVPTYFPMESDRVRTQLLHVCQDCNPAAFSCHGGQHLQSGLHRHGAGIVAVVNNRDSAPLKYLLASLIALKLPQGKGRLLHGKPVCIRHCQ